MLSAKSLRPSNPNVSLSRIAVTAAALEVIHCVNAHWVLHRWPGWEINSALDSYVIHTALFGNFLRYFRDFSALEFALFAVARVAVETLPEHLGGLLDVKAAPANAAAGPLHFLRLSLGYGAALVATQAILTRGAAFRHPVFYAFLALAFPLTLLQASHYMYKKEAATFYGAHAANFLTLNPVAIAWLLRKTIATKK